MSNTLLPGFIRKINNAVVDVHRTQSLSSAVFSNVNAKKKKMKNYNYCNLIRFQRIFSFNSIKRCASRVL